MNKRFERKKSSPSNLLKVYFDNKGIEYVNIPSLLKKVSDAIPNSFIIRDSPTVLYTRSPRIGCKIFNYKKVVDELVTKNWKADNDSCDCSISKFWDKNHGHIVT